MKKTSTIVALAFLAGGFISSCNNAPTAETGDAAAEETHGAHEGHAHHGDEEGKPPHGEEGRPPRGDRKGPPAREGGHNAEQTKTLEEIGGYKIGEVATDFSLKNVDGKNVSLASVKGAKGYVVTFTCNECPFSKLYEDRLIALNNKYAPLGYPVVAINPNSDANEKEGYAAMQARAEEKGFTFPYLMDEGQKIYPQYGAVRTPHVFLLDGARKVQYIGTIDDNPREAEEVKVKYLEDAIAALQKGEKPDPNFTKAIGCPVKAARERS